MNEFIHILKRFVPPYRKNLIMNIIYNVLHAAFGGVSFLMMIPVLSILFGTQEDVLDMIPWAPSMEAIKHNFYYYITSVKLDYGASYSLLLIGLVMIVAVLLKTSFSYLASYEMINIRTSIVKDLRNKIYQKILSLPMPFFSDEKKGDILARSTGDVSEVENSIMNSLDMFFKNPIIIIVSLTMMLIMSWELTLFVLILLPFAGAIIGKIGKTLKKRSTKGQAKMGEILSALEETLSGLRIIKAFNAEPRMEKSFDKQTNEYRRIMNSLSRRRELAHPTSEFLGTIVIVIVLWFGGTLILSKASVMDPEVFLSYLVVFYSIINPAKQFSNAFYSIQKGLASMERIDKILMTESSIQDKENAIEIKEFNNKVEYRNVSFSYIDNRDVLKDVSVDINKGMIVALVGQSGSGKTTFADLLPRFYDVNNGGGIFIDGHNIKDLSMKSLRALMGNVNQDPILFNDTIYNNIAFGLENASEEAVINAAKIANAHNFIIETENGYQTNIGDRGGKLSGGQRQRLSIARAILKNPPILILDEATSALDTESERLVQDALYKLMANRTSVVVAHRLSTIKNADLICVFHEGEIIERGTHAELVALGGTYFKLQEMQSF